MPVTQRTLSATNKSTRSWTDTRTTKSSDVPQVNGSYIELDDYKGVPGPWNTIGVASPQSAHLGTNVSIQGDVERQSGVEKIDGIHTQRTILVE